MLLPFVTLTIAFLLLYSEHTVKWKRNTKRQPKYMYIYKKNELDQNNN